MKQIRSRTDNVIKSGAWSSIAYLINVLMEHHGYGSIRPSKKDVCCRIFLYLSKPLSLASLDSSPTEGSLWRRGKALPECQGLSSIGEVARRQA